MYVHFVWFTAHSELSEQPLEQAESSNMAEPVPVLADASIMQDAVMQVIIVVGNRRKDQTMWRGLGA